MVEFKVIKRIKFNGKMFVLLSSREYPFYIMEIDNNGKLKYPKYEDFIGFLKSNKNNRMNTLLNSCIINSNNKKGVLNKIKLLPKVAYKGLLISISTALLMSGCSKNSSDDYVNYEDYKEDIISECDYLGYDVYFTDYDVPYLHEFECEDFGGDSIFCKNINEFKERLNINETYSYDDIRKCFSNNKNIPNEYKEWIYNGLNNMEKQLPDLDLTVLHFNAERMKFIKMDEPETNNEDSSFVVPASFDISTGEVFYNPSSYGFEAFTLCHEVLGHGSMECVTEADDGKYVYYGFYVPTISYDGSYFENQFLGISFTEGAADLIAKIASNSIQESAYRFVEEELRIIQELCGLSLSGMLNCRGVELLDKMYKNHIDDPSVYVLCSDNVLQNFRTFQSYENADYVGISDIIECLVIDATEEIVLDNGAINNAVGIMKNTDYKDGIELFYYNPDGSVIVLDNYNYIESSNYVSSELSNIKKKTRK